MSTIQDFITDRTSGTRVLRRRGRANKKRDKKDIAVKEWIFQQDTPGKINVLPYEHEFSLEHL